jgi:hypothetical protein
MHTERFISALISRRLRAINFGARSHRRPASLSTRAVRSRRSGIVSTVEAVRRQLERGRGSKIIQHDVRYTEMAPNRFLVRGRAPISRKAMTRGVMHPPWAISHAMDTRRIKVANNGALTLTLPGQRLAGLALLCRRRRRARAAALGGPQLLRLLPSGCRVGLAPTAASPCRGVRQQQKLHSARYEQHRLDTRFD